MSCVTVFLSSSSSSSLLDDDGWVGSRPWEIVGGGGRRYSYVRERIMLRSCLWLCELGGLKLVGGARGGAEAVKDGE